MRLGPPEIILILVVVILIFGVGKLPQIGKSLGEGLRSFKKAQDEVNTEVKAINASVEGKPAPKEKVVETPSTPPPPPPQASDDA
ncbi:twin-arginine translocase TatA/TatE family subunit [Dehalogenimonas etheniformans]|uniref:Sec-independent protein translocase protein TatA n=1 Tax=Dehalogenimonas etheniformans TaxID=1536648 RepID=A0A2P5P615_9CHLR|nr:twin-arginine translocase TatA/TatE family subunit [Dehalogenimonas etheniformans]PPD57725.1 twin-arginine translocase TatA/TatE family subunit [Dehalogenimonas etheniformans]QNT76065.1 twin-arginine translocase TatA/TatE family subunit [Dehalogenimonas etheniformans]